MIARHRGENPCEAAQMGSHLLDAPLECLLRAPARVGDLMPSPFTRMLPKKAKTFSRSGSDIDVGVTQVSEKNDVGARIKLPYHLDMSSFHGDHEIGKHDICARETPGAMLGQVHSEAACTVPSLGRRGISEFGVRAT